MRLAVLVVLGLVPVPVEVDLDAPVLIDVDLLVRMSDDHRGLRPLDRGLRGRLGREVLLVGGRAREAAAEHLARLHALCRGTVGRALAGVEAVAAPLGLGADDQELPAIAGGSPREGDGAPGGQPPRIARALHPGMAGLEFEQADLGRQLARRIEVVSTRIVEDLEAGVGADRASRFVRAWRLSLGFMKL